MCDGDWSTCMLNFCQSEFCMAQTTVDHFYGMGKYSSQLPVTDAFFLIFSSKANDEITKIT